MKQHPIRRIAHLDMDAFYASVERLRYPQLKSVAFVVGAGHGLLQARLQRLRELYPDRDWTDADRAHIPLDAFPRLSDYAGRGVITTATYEARRYGIGSAMGLMKAARLCPDAILLPTDFRQYRKYSQRFKEIIVGHAPLMEDRGIDEVYIDFTETPDGQLEGGRILATRIQRDILQATGLTCSIGVAPNKLIAKMASEFRKPGGISIVHEEDLQSLIWPLPCRKIGGIGPKTDARLQEHGIRTIGELAACDPEWLTDRFGVRHGAWMHEAAWGRDERPVQTESEPVSMSRETTFERDLHAVRDRAELGAVFTRLAEQLSADLVASGYAGRTIGVKLRFSDFRIVTRDQSITEHVQDARRIRQIAGGCLKRVDLSQRLRLLGLRVASLRRLDSVSESAGDTTPPGNELPLFHPDTTQHPRDQSRFS